MLLGPQSIQLQIQGHLTYLFTQMSEPQSGTTSKSQNYNQIEKILVTHTVSHLQIVSPATDATNSIELKKTKENKPIKRFKQNS